MHEYYQTISIVLTVLTVFNIRGILLPSQLLFVSAYRESA